MLLRQNIEEILRIIYYNFIYKNNFQLEISIELCYFILLNCYTNSNHSLNNKHCFHKTIPDTFPFIREH